MTKSATLLPMRQSDDGKWEVQMSGGTWVKCENETDAKILSDAPVLEASWLENRPLNKELAEKLESTARAMDRYSMRSDARRFRKWAKLAGHS